MKQKIKRYLTLSLIIWGFYFVLWLMVMFVKWEYTNPLEPFLRLPKESNSYRLTLLTIWATIEFIKLPFVLKDKI